MCCSLLRHNPNYARDVVNICLCQQWR